MCYVSCSIRVNWILMVKYIFSSRPDNTLKHLSYDPIGPEWLNELGSWIKRCTRLTAASDKVYQLLAHGRWFSPGTPATSTTKTGRYDIAEILLKVALNTKKSNQINLMIHYCFILLTSKLGLHEFGNTQLITCLCFPARWTENTGAWSDVCSWR